MIIDERIKFLAQAIKDQIPFDIIAKEIGAKEYELEKDILTLLFYQVEEIVNAVKDFEMFWANRFFEETGLQHDDPKATSLLVKYRIAILQKEYGTVEAFYLMRKLFFKHYEQLHHFVGHQKEYRNVIFPERKSSKGADGKLHFVRSNDVQDVPPPPPDRRKKLPVKEEPLPEKPLPEETKPPKEVCKPAPKKRAPKPIILPPPPPPIPIPKEKENVSPPIHEHKPLWEEWENKDPGAKTNTKALDDYEKAYGNIPPPKNPEKTTGKTKAKLD